MDRLTTAQKEVLALLHAGWTFTPGPRYLKGPAPLDAGRGFFMRVHPPAGYAGPKPRVEQTTLHALMARGLVERTGGRRYQLPEARMTAQDRAMFLLLTDWTIHRMPDFLDPPPSDLRFGPPARLTPPPGYAGPAPRDVRQATLEVLLRDGHVVLTPDGAYELPPAPPETRGAGRKMAFAPAPVSAP
jgi:hypothetical protein